MNYLTKISRLFQSKGNNLNILRYLHIQKSTNVPPVILHTDLINNAWIWQKKSQIQLPLITNIKLELPNTLKQITPVVEQTVQNGIEVPGVNNGDIPKQAARLIVIRRKKMKKHKLRKLRKKMKFEWAKLRQRRELKKEKEFQAKLIQQCKEAEAFSAEKYVQERIDKLNEIIIPRYWKGKRLPEFIIREKMGLPPKK
ncbi:hypothetical protein NQ318_015631 [Aromia moschata]|uniref:Small ribosomal subunit protein mS38 n=1 Tax=Aromia moschata TaxID=1265417 RepID=A0AAV8XEK4_9CUCU|nr:hypothetical protein NQ318_015631 [Aromia moschata]